MKVKFEIDASPEEWRRFFGMPDVTEVNHQIIEDMKAKIANGEVDYAQAIKHLMPENIQQLADMQKDFWDNLFQQNKSK